MSNSRKIKKYPNRRLYDTELSHYITLADIRELVMKGTAFQVIDSQTEDDITRSILLQIMLEEESGGKPLFSANMLSQIIRFYGGTIQGLFAQYLEQSLRVFVEQQEQMNQSISVDPLKAMSEMTDNNMRFWTGMQERFMQNNPFAATGEKLPTKSNEPS